MHDLDVVGRGRNHGKRIVHPAEVELADARRVPLLDQEAARALVQALDHLVLGIGELQAFDVVLAAGVRSEEHTSELQSLMRISYAVFCLKKKTHSKERKT